MQCGLDFGTSNSTIGTAANGMPRLFPIEGDRVTIPSVIFFSFEDDRTLFGRAALAEYVAGTDGRVMRSLKSVLGSALINDKTRVKDEVLAFSDILGLFIGMLKYRAEVALGAPIDAVVAGRPVQFVDDDPVADREAQQQLEEALRSQGFDAVEFQFEPIAAALDYERTITGEKLALVADLGGGTSDFTVIRVSPDRAKASDRKRDILATAGVHIGGTDFDRLLSMRQIMPLLGRGSPTADGKRYLPVAPYNDLSTWHRINRLYDQRTMIELRQTRREARSPMPVEDMMAIIEARAGHRLLTAVEDSKIALSSHELVAFRFDVDEVVLETPIARDDLNAAIEDAVGRITKTIDKTLHLAGVRAGAIQSLILTGGSTEVPAVAAALAAQFPEAELVRTDAFGSVGLGLALDASRRFGPA
ncbi:MAG: YegD [Devosia sp.]|nr:YegD [Devosia sp.]